MNRQSAGVPTGAPSMRVFFDTEFTSLGSDPPLLSMGLVAAEGKKLYIEITDGWSEASAACIQNASPVRRRALREMEY